MTDLRQALTTILSEKPNVLDFDDDDGTIYEWVGDGIRFGVRVEKDATRSIWYFWTNSKYNHIGGSGYLYEALNDD